MISSKAGSFLLGILTAIFVTLFYRAFFLNERTVTLTSLISVQKNRPTQRIVEKYRSQVKERQEWMKQVTKDNFARIYNNLAPEAYCAEEVKVGITDDGGKWVCGPYNLPNGCTIFSVGLSNSVSFEEDLQTITEKRCKVFGFDKNTPNSTTLGILERIGAKAITTQIAAASDPPSGGQSLEELMKINNVNEIEILKIDVEGSEFAVLPDFLKKHRVAQILIEVHGDPKKTLYFLRWLSSLGYLLFHYEINGAYHQLCEYAFIHETALERYDATLLARYLNF